VAQDRNLDLVLRQPGYNTQVASPARSKPVSDRRQRRRHAAYAAETTGLLVIAILALILVLIGYWPNIPWSAR
jgi:hypothetical protein